MGNLRDVRASYWAASGQYAFQTPYTAAVAVLGARPSAPIWLGRSVAVCAVTWRMPW
jgi:hypothetical protein